MVRWSNLSQVNTFDEAAFVIKGDMDRMRKASPKPSNSFLGGRNGMDLLCLCEKYIKHPQIWSPLVEKKGDTPL